ncbi:MAG: PIN domain-containing protein [Bdellovibrionales bacterium]|nr:PIN domain-containing protein [Bdellovibrionales bacterium]
MEKIVLDANVLYSNTLRGLFLWLSWNKLCEIIWAKEIWDEVFRNYSKDPETEQKFRSHIESVVFVRFGDSIRLLKPGFTPVGLPDSSDEHVVGLARQEGASVVVTFNLKDFPEKLLNTVQLKRSHPDSFLCRLYDNFPDEVKASVADQVRSLRTTMPSKIVYFESLKKTEAKEFVRKLEVSEAEGTLFSEIWI